MSAFRMHWRQLLVLMLALPWLTASIGVAAELPGLDLDAITPSVELAGRAHYLEDATTALAIEDIRARRSEFVATSAERGINFGYSASAYWLHVRLNNSSSETSRWMLEIAYPALDRLDVYLLHANGQLHLSAGDQLPFSTRPIAHNNFVFPLRVPPGQSELYLRAASSGTVTLPASLWRADAFPTHSEVRYAAVALYFGWIFALGLYNLLLYFSTRDRVFLAYVFFVASFALASLVYTGMAAQFLWPESPGWGDPALIVGLCLTVLSSALFTTVFLQTARHQPWLDKALRFIVAGSALSLALLAGLPQRYPTLLIAVFGFAFVIAGPIAAVQALRRRQPGANYFLVAWSFFFLGTLIFNLRNTGLIPTNAFTLYAIQFGSAVEMLLLSFALADRLNTLRREIARAQAEALAAKQTLVDNLRESEALLEHRVSERTAELEVANQRLRESEDLLRNLAQHDTLTGLPNRLLLNAHLGQCIRRARRNGKHFALLMIDLDGFKPINDTFGHDAGDSLLRCVGHRLAEGIREADLAARVGGDEFVCVVESVDGADDALMIAEKLIAQVRQPVTLDSGQCVQVGASIGIALFDDPGLDAESLTRMADSAMYAAKHAGKNCARVADRAS